MPSTLTPEAPETSETIPEPADNPTVSIPNYNSFPVYNAVASSLQNRANGITKRHRAIAPDLLRGLLMVIMALDHVSGQINIWGHGTNLVGEQDGVVVEKWNYPIAYIVRSLTHLCASGFTFLLGMGIVYLGKSRQKAGWSAWQLTRYFALRMLVLTGMTIFLGLAVSMGRLWFLNAVLFALAVDYFLAGMVWLAMSYTEPAVADFIERSIPNQDEEGGGDDEAPLLGGAHKVRRWNGETISWHLHNLMLIVLSIVTIWWNIWLSDNNGYCAVSSSSSITTELRLDTFGNSALATSTATVATNSLPTNIIWRIWFWPVMDMSVLKTGLFSGFPPMAWLSFALLGLLYGRLLNSKPWTTITTISHVLISAGLMVLFVLTRVFRFGNLSENCLRTPDQIQHPESNPYLVSARSFFYIVKYPPDVAFWALTMSVNLLLLALFGSIPHHISKKFTLLLDLGGASLFFYMVHMFAIMAAGTVLLPLFGHEVEQSNPFQSGKPLAITNIYGYFAIWGGLILVLWPLCRWYGRYKSTKGVDSLWRFF